jgi:hypothetical protein
MKRWVWVVEMFVNGKWFPCAECSLTKIGGNGYNKLQQWRENNPADKFRLAKYVRAKP